MSDDTVLTAIVDGVIPDDMGTDFLLAPAVALRGKYSFQLILISRFILPDGAVVLPGRAFFPDTDRTTFGIMNDIMLNNPAFAPVYAEQSRLVSRGRRPWSCCMGHFKASYRNIVDPGLFRIEAGSAHINFHELLSRIGSLEICINRCSIRIYLGKPYIFCLLRVMDRHYFSCPLIQYLCPDTWGIKFLEAIGLIKGHTI